MNITTIGIDLAKTSFSLVGADKHGKIVARSAFTIYPCSLDEAATRQIKALFM